MKDTQVSPQNHCPRSSSRNGSISSTVASSAASASYHSESGSGAPPGSLQSIRLLQEVQGLPGTHGPHARHMMSFLQRLWWSSVRARCQESPCGPVDQHGGSKEAACCQNGARSVARAAQHQGERNFSPAHPKCLSSERGGSSDNSNGRGSVTGSSTPPALSGSTLGHPRNRWSCFALSGSIRYYQRAPGRVVRSTSCPGRMEYSAYFPAAHAASGASAGTRSVRASGRNPLFQPFHMDGDTRMPMKNGRSRKTQHHGQEEDQDHNPHRRKGTGPAGGACGGDCDDLLRKKLWTLGSLPDHAMVVKVPSQVGRLSSCIFPPLGGPSIRGTRGDHASRDKNSPPLSGIKLLPVVTPKGDENPRRASVHVVMNAECDGTPDGQPTGFHDGRQSQWSEGGLHGHLRQPHHRLPPTASPSSNVRGRREERGPPADQAAAAPGAGWWIRSPQESPGGAAGTTGVADGAMTPSPASSTATAAPSRPMLNNNRGVPGKTVISTVCACSWSDPPTVRACPIQKYLAHTQHRDLGALCLGPAASAAEAEEEQLVQCLSGCSNCREETASGHCAINHKHSTSGGGCHRGAPRYVAMSDCLGEYPEILVQLLRGPLAKRHPEVDLLRLQREAKPKQDSEEPARTDLCLWIGAFSIPRDDKRYRGGEDAWFLDASNNAFGVADGVSEWEDLAGINPQEYAQDLMQGTQEAIGKIQTEQRSRTKQAETEGTGGGAQAGTQTGRQTCNPADVAKEALTRAYHKARNFGSSTAIVGVLDGETGIFGLANLGDSSSLVLRRPRVRGSLGQLSLVKKVKEMQHGFNVPFQFAHLPAPEEWDELLQRGLTRLVSIAKQEYDQGDGGRIGDEPSAIQSTSVPVQDGLAVSPHEAQTLLGDASLATPPEDVARALALAAYWRSLDRDAQTPFSKEARRCCNKQSLPVQTPDGSTGAHQASPAHAMFLAGLLSGGKEDDITVAAAWVCRRDRCVYTENDGKQSSPPYTRRESQAGQFRRPQQQQCQQASQGEDVKAKKTGLSNGQGSGPSYSKPTDASTSK
ncbi:hypothetical protein, conserved [Eimeria necatrix]|uniref:PPM-type phosphatase domain-containing protein n=1 Tax=Eimeria necatrix TaxID=51315 RepID=U6MZ47_9EIME|nr:hypothetical protein, conserved [Eimeria necatrix]CDJ69503.1 hypothetical protein, conserved [Eimeria necatrix]